jgi:hypothetical protein
MIHIHELELILNLQEWYNATIMEAKPRSESRYFNLGVCGV